MIFLKRLRRCVLVMKDSLNSFYGGIRRGDCRHIRNLVLSRHHADVAVAGLALSADRGIEDQVQLLVLDHVANVRTSFQQLLDMGVRDSVFRQEFAGAFRREDLESEFMDMLRNRKQILALASCNGDQHLGRRSEA